jgi:hypothetical protein
MPIYLCYCIDNFAVCRYICVYLYECMSSVRKVWILSGGCNRKNNCVYHLPFFLIVSHHLAVEWLSLLLHIAGGGGPGSTLDLRVSCLD